jgi:hypothetical protein
MVNGSKLREEKTANGLRFSPILGSNRKPHATQSRWYKFNQLADTSDLGEIKTPHEYRRIETPTGRKDFEKARSQHTLVGEARAKGHHITGPCPEVAEVPRKSAKVERQSMTEEMYEKYDAILRLFRSIYPSFGSARKGEQDLSQCVP